MKIAVGIISIFLGLIVLLQSCAITAASSLADDQATGGAGAIGVLVGLMFFVAGAFSFALPLVSAIVLFIGGLLAFLASTSGRFADISIWGGISLALAVASFLTWRSNKRRAVTSPSQ